MTSTTKLLIEEFKKGDSPVFDDIAAEMIQGNDIIADRVLSNIEQGTPCPIECEAIATGVISPRRQEILRRLNAGATDARAPKADSRLSPSGVGRLGDDTRLLIVPRSLIERAVQVEEKMRLLGNVRFIDDWNEADAFVKETTDLLKKVLG